LLLIDIINLAFEKLRLYVIGFNHKIRKNLCQANLYGADNHILITLFDTRLNICYKKNNWISWL